MDPTLGNESAVTPGGATPLDNAEVPDPARPQKRTTGLHNKWVQWLLAFIGIFFLTSSWTLSTPEYASQDEWAHVYRAVSVVRGEIAPKADDQLGGGSGYLNVPQTYISERVAASCYPFKNAVTADCIATVENESQLVETTSGAARYNPFYYLLVGWPSLITTGPISLMLMRLAGAVICSGLLASAVLSAVRGRHGRFWLLGLLISMTPMTLFLESVVNPNGLEIAAAAGTWVALARLCTGTSDETGALLRRFGIAASCLVLSRGLSPLWLAIIGLTCLAIGNGAALKRLARRVDTWVWAVITLIATMGSVGWTMTIGSGKVPDLTAEKELTTFEASMRILLQFGIRMHQFVGEFGWGDTPVPGFLGLLFAVIFGALIFVALACATRRVALVLGLLFVVVVFLPILLEAMQYNKLGLFWQSRYTIPIAIGLCIVPAYAIGEYLDRRAVAQSAPRVDGFGRAVGLVVGSLAFIHLLSFDTAIVRYSSGYLETLNPFIGAWHPASGAWTVVLLQVIGVAVVFGMPYWMFRSRGQRPKQSTDLTTSRAHNDQDSMATQEGPTLTNAGPATGA